MNKREKIRILYVCHTSTQLGGAAHSLYYMIESAKEFVHPIVLLSAYGQTYDFFVKHGIECIVCEFASSVRKKGFIRNTILFLPILIQRFFINRKCVNFVRNAHLGIDIVHTNSSITSIGYFIARRIKARHIWHIREFMDEDYELKPFLGWNVLRGRMGKSEKVIAISKAVYFHWHLGEMGNGIVLWNAVRSKDSICYNAAKKKYFLFCAGKLSDSKGADMAVKAFALSKLYRQSYTLKLIGSYSDEYKNRLIEIAKSNGTDVKSIELLGHLDDVNQLMQSATAFLMCSKNEGLGRVTIEAMFNGCPVLARDTGGTLDFVKDGTNGYIFHDEKQCADLMKRLVISDNDEIIKSAQQFVAEHFSLEKYSNSIHNLYFRGE